MDEYFLGYNDAIADAEKIAISPKALKVMLGIAAPIATLSVIRDVRKMPAILKRTNRETRAAVARAKEVAGKKWLIMKPSEQAQLMVQYLPGGPQYRPGLGVGGISRGTGRGLGMIDQGRGLGPGHGKGFGLSAVERTKLRKEAGAFPPIGKALTRFGRMGFLMPLMYFTDVTRWLKMGKPMFRPHKMVPKTTIRGLWR